MTYRDRWEDCQTCGRRYVFTVEMQRQISSSGQEEEPEYHCPTCTRTGGQAPQSGMQLDPVTGHWVGSVKWFDLEKGYGFIDRGDGTDIFFHKSETRGEVTDFAEGRAVTYDVEETLKGPQAVEVQPFAS